MPVISKHTALATVLLVFHLPVSGGPQFVHLAYAPGKSIDNPDRSLESAWSGHLISVKPVLFEQKKGKQIIGYRSDDHEDYYWSNEDIATWATCFVRYALVEAGLKLSSKERTLTLQPALLYMFVKEGSVYNGYIRMHFDLRDATGAPIWNKTVIDSSSWWGETFSEKEYLSAIGNAFIGVLGAFIADTSLLAVLPSAPGTRALYPNRTLPIIDYRKPIDAGLRGSMPPNSGTKMLIQGCSLLAAGTVLITISSVNQSEAVTIPFRIASIPVFIAGGVVTSISIPFTASTSIWKNDERIRYRRESR